MGALQTFLDSLSAEQLVDRLTLALDGTDLGIWDWDLRDNSVQFDRRWCEMLGLDHATTPMELFTWSSRVHPFDLPGCYADIQAHLDGRTARYENIHRMRHADGRWIYILDRGRIAERDAKGAPIRFTGTHFDVTATEKAKAVLARHGRLLEDLIANLPAGVAMFDAELRLLCVSPQWARDQGLAQVPSLGEPLAAVLPATAARWEGPLRAALRGAGPNAEEELVVGEDGRARHLRWDIRPWKEADGALGGVVHFTEDVSAAVAQRRQLAQAQEARLAALSLFAGGLSHELNSPLQIILSEAEALAEASDDPVAVAEGVGAIVSTARRAAGITRALRTLSRDARGDPPEALGLGALLADAEALCRSRFESGGVVLCIDEAPRDLALWGRPAELLYALLSLLHAAFDGAPAGVTGVSLRVEVAGNDVWLHISGGDAPALPARADLTHTAALLARDGGALDVLADRRFVVRLPLAAGHG